MVLLIQQITSPNPSRPKHYSCTVDISTLRDAGSIPAEERKISFDTISRTVGENKYTV